MFCAIRKKLGQDVWCRRADAERRLPFRDASFAYVFSSFTYHHMKSPSRFFQQVCRILQAGGRFVLVGATLEQALSRELLPFFPQLACVEEHRYLSLDELLAAFWRAGFVHVQHDSWHFETRNINETYLERVRLGQVNSALSFLIRAELQEGMSRIGEAIPRHLSFNIERTVVSGIRPNELRCSRKRCAVLPSEAQCLAQEVRTIVKRCSGGSTEPSVLRVVQRNHVNSSETRYAQSPQQQA